MEILVKVLSDYRLYLTIIGSLSYLAIYIIDRLNSSNENQTPLTFGMLCLLILSYIMIGFFTYICFYFSLLLWYLCSDLHLYF